MTTRALALLLLVLCAGPASATLPLGDEDRATVIFRTSPSGAQVIRLGLRSLDLGSTGQPVIVSFPHDRDINIPLRFQLDGYADFDLEISSAELRGSGQMPRPYPADRDIPLTPKSPFSAAAHFVRMHPVAMTVTAGMALGGLFGVVLPFRRRTLERARRLHGLAKSAGQEANALVGKPLGKAWFLTRLLGRGGCGAVYEAVPFDTLDGDNRVAVKVIHTMDAESRARFKREVNITKSLNHPNIVRLLDWEEGDIFYMVLELVDGAALGELLPPGGMAVSEALSLAEGVFAALDHAHHKGVVHCDMKPGNILVTRHGQARVMDFGIASGRAYPRLTRTASVLGTPGYMAPEQMDGHRNDPRSDQYAVGVILFEMLVGERPFEDEDWFHQISLTLTQPPPRLSDLRPSIPAAVSDVVDRMLAKDPAQRFPSMGEAWGSLRAAAGWDVKPAM